MTGKITKIIDSTATSMHVYEDGIYYKEEIVHTDEDENWVFVDRSNSYYSFENKTITKIGTPYISMSIWKEYHVTNKVEAVEGTPGLEKLFL